MSITPGPWKAECFDPAEFPYWWRVMADMPGDPVGDAMSQDDARLIAAAPDLLAACERMLVLLHADGFNGYEADWDQAKTAISKAKGTTDERSTA